MTVRRWWAEWSSAVWVVVSVLMAGMNFGFALRGCVEPGSPSSQEAYPARNVCVSADPHGCRNRDNWPTAWAEAEFAHSWRDADAGCMRLETPARDLGYDEHHTVVVQPRRVLTSEGCGRERR